ncbi:MULTISPECIES: hypothetical protein [unclassified Sphingomonas]|uniref:hypothetical protein n=1 Tax=unclassified Sphingomonas TaxID=196159 RepID=UPI000927C172|nr:MULTISPECIES: hypothetical protein [unclassified Sphingomonas]MBN8846539.1 hypothetical protein [Sphingomonas sp.]MBS0284051.1 hypothetical protein [Pseudomonadota bacterium]OJV27296.1 MAG: hypothetical protein BGO24_00055 [Sphingomonas sp. 67-36]
MLRTIIGALVGGELERREGGGGVKGALLGAVLTRAVTRMGPLGLALGGAYVAKKAYDRRKARRADAGAASAE